MYIVKGKLKGRASNFIYTLWKQRYVKHVARKNQ